MVTDLATVKGWLKRRVNEHEFREFLAASLLDLCRIDTIPTRNVTDTARREGQLLSLIEQLIHSHGPAGRLERRPISQSIAAHSFYTFPHYAGSGDVYDSRGNLLYLYDAPPVCGTGSVPADRRTAGTESAGSGLAVNAHIDTVAPYLPARREGERLFGRGACDDKSGCAVMIAALRLLGELEQRFGVRPASDLTFMFVIEEEMGGNGSLALALDEQLSQRYRIMVVLECCDGQVHPGGRGALWYRVEIPACDEDQPESLPGDNPVVLALEIIRSMDREGGAIRAESDHPLFPRTAVQTSPGILGSFGEHPARICASVAFELHAQGAEAQLEQLDSGLKAGLREYVRRYGDKMQSHYDLRSTASGTVELHVHGLSGHMGALYENDNALIKAAYLLEAVRFTPEAGEDGWGIGLLDPQRHSPLLLEGGQGFVPNHSMDQIKSRLSAAVQRAYRRYAWNTWKRVPYSGDMTPRVSFAKLHNEAYQSDPAAPAVVDALAAAEEAGIDIRRPIMGWEVSSDARIFAHLRPGVSVFTTGPGKLAMAHSDQEQITIEELCRATLMLTLFILRHGGFVSGEGGSGIR